MTAPLTTPDPPAASPIEPAGLPVLAGVVTPADLVPAASVATQVPRTPPPPASRPRRPGRLVRGALALAAAALLVGACASELPAPSATGASSAGPSSSPAPASPHATVKPSSSGPPTAGPTVSPVPSASSSPSPSAVAGAQRSPCPANAGTARRGTIATGQSRNWSGYIVGASSGHVTCVEGTWTQPTITCPATGLASVAIWVGIDGTTAAGGLPNASATLAQVGTAGDCAEGQLQVMAWYEFLPDLHHEVPMSVQVRAGDKIWAQVRYLGKGKFRATLVNLTLKVGASQTWTVRGAPLLTAEWIVEAPASQCSADSCSILPLAKFSTVAMDGYTTLNNRRYRVSAVPDPYLRISIARRGHVLAAPGSLKSGGGFNVIWKGS